MDTTEPQQAVIDVNPDAAHKPPKRWSGFIILLLLLLLGACAYIGWQAWLLKKSIAANQAELQALQKSVTDQNNGDKSALQALQQTTVALTNKIIQAENTAREVRQQLAHNQTDWQLAEAFYSVEWAARRLQIGRDVNTAILLLESADNGIASLSAPDLLPVRQALAKDISALKSIPLPDQDGILFKLQALSDRILQLPLRPPVPAMTDTPSTEQAKPETQRWWQKVWHSLAAGMQDLVRIRRHSHGIEPLLAPDQTRYLQANMELQLQQAMLALLTGKPALYVSSVDKAVLGLNNYYDKQSPQVTAAINELTALKKVEMAPTLPLPSASLSALKQVIDARKQAALSDRVPVS